MIVDNAQPLPQFLGFDGLAGFSLPAQRLERPERTAARPPFQVHQ